MILEKLQSRNKQLIAKYTKANDKQKVKKLLLIDQILKNPNCFFDMKIEEAYQILACMDFKENEIDKLYLALISPNKK